jgi:hypothetical protein
MPLIVTGLFLLELPPGCKRARNLKGILYPWLSSKAIGMFA